MLSSDFYRKAKVALILKRNQADDRARGSLDDVIFEFSAETRKPSRDGFISGFLETRDVFCDPLSYLSLSHPGVVIGFGAEMVAIERGIRDNMKKNLASHVLLRPTYGIVLLGASADG
uniref:Uncharacterized protein n=1 Tax=Strigamia maritima TaxID=126957 RepID=T1JJS4_STRMM